MGIVTCFSWVFDQTSEVNDYGRQIFKRQVNLLFSCEVSSSFLKGSFLLDTGQRKRCQWWAVVVVGEEEEEVEDNGQGAIEGKEESLLMACLFTSLCCWVGWPLSLLHLFLFSRSLWSPLNARRQDKKGFYPEHERLTCPASLLQYRLLIDGLNYSFFLASPSHIILSEGEYYFSLISGLQVEKVVGACKPKSLSLMWLENTIHVSGKVLYWNSKAFQLIFHSTIIQIFMGDWRK